MHIIGMNHKKDELFFEFAPDETNLATKTIMLLKKSGYKIADVSEEEYKSRLEKFKNRPDSRKSD